MSSTDEESEETGIQIAYSLSDLVGLDDDGNVDGAQAMQVSELPGVSQNQEQWSNSTSHEQIQASHQSKNGTEETKRHQGKVQYQSFIGVTNDIENSQASTNSSQDNPPGVKMKNENLETEKAKTMEACVTTGARNCEIHDQGAEKSATINVIQTEPEGVKHGSAQKPVPDVGVSQEKSPSPAKSAGSVKSDIGGRMFYERSSSPGNLLNPLEPPEEVPNLYIVERHSDGEEIINYDSTELYDNEVYETAPRDLGYNTSSAGHGNPRMVKVLPDLPPASGQPVLRHKKSTGLTSSGDHGDAEEVYEPVLGDESHETNDDDLSWGSSEFESYDDDSEEVATSPRESQLIEVTVTHRSSKPLEPTVLNKLAANLKIGSKGVRKSEDLDDDLTCVEVTLDPEKHPPPQLPPTPTSLDSNQLKRRHIVASIVESENSYINSLKRIVEDYEKALLPTKHPIIPKAAVNTIFFKVRDILQCHNMFSIELAEAIRSWDEKEELGNIFTASFSKSIVCDVYSAYVNNFTEAMETSKKLARQKPAFSEFLKEKIVTAPDKLSLYGLMVKPVQRFPQFILLLQDLLKHTPRDHHDRLALQLALSELENLTFKLNEMKRESENIRDVKQMLSSLTGRYSLKTDNSRYLLRQDDVLQLDCNQGEKKSKARRLLLLSDQLICASVLQKESDTGPTEKYKVKWSVPLPEVEVVQAVINTFYQIKSGPGRTTIVAPKLDKTTFTPWKKDLDDMLHDLPIIEHMATLASQLRLEYEGVTEHMFEDLHRSLQLMIQQHSNIDNCILQLAVPSKYMLTAANKMKEEMNKLKNKSSSAARPTKFTVMLQMLTPGIKQEWLLELKNARLALDPRNKPAWCIPEAEQTHTFKLPLFIKPLLIDITKFNSKHESRQEESIYSNCNRIQCAIQVLIPNPHNPYVSTQHLWVCSSEPGRGQATVVAMHSDQPHVIESFQACQWPISCAEVVPGFAVVNDDYAFWQDTVWMALDNNQLIIHKVLVEERSDPGDPEVVLDTEDTILCMKYLDTRLYAGMKSGTLLIFCRDQDGVWDFEHKLQVKLGPEPITCLHSINHEMWAACGSSIHTITVTTRIKQDRVTQELQQDVHEVGYGEGEIVECMVTAGTGLLVSFRNKSIIRIFCLETFHHLQDVNIASVIDKVITGKTLQKDAASQDRHIRITCMLASRGLLWIGTDNGCVATLPLPRLEGVPQIKGRPCVSYHAHNGPIKFLVPIHCGATPVRQPMSWVESEPSDSENKSQDSNDEIDRPIPNDGEGISISGVTETESNDYKTFTQSDQYDEVTSKTRSEAHNEGSNSLRRQLPSKTKWTSTPDLRQTLTGSKEDVVSLYGNLLQGAEVEEYEHDLLEPRRRRPLSDTSHYFSNQHSSMVRRRTGRNKYLTLPANCNRDYEETQKLDELLTEDKLSTNNRLVIPGFETMRPHTTLGGSTASSRSVIVVSGGEGHINWSQKNAGDNRYEDICLLLWQCQT